MVEIHPSPAKSELYGSRTRAYGQPCQRWNITIASLSRPLLCIRYRSINLRPKCDVSQVQLAKLSSDQQLWRKKANLLIEENKRLAQELSATQHKGGELQKQMYELRGQLGAEQRDRGTTTSEQEHRAVPTLSTVVDDIHDPSHRLTKRYVARMANIDERLIG